MSLYFTHLTIKSGSVPGSNQTIQRKFRGYFLLMAYLFSSYAVNAIWIEREMVICHDNSMESLYMFMVAWLGFKLVYKCACPSLEADGRGDVQRRIC